ncbi:MAG: CHAT domain-containing protein, partial [Saprospiraceae bacterium]|nr:CHAT domain-containing protein [Saprospiraceae bacterium]
HLKQDMRMYSALLGQTDSPAEAGQKAFWQEAVSVTRDAYADLIKRLENQYPEYYQLKFAPATFDLDRVLRALPEDALAIEYFMGEGKIYVFALDADTQQWIVIDNVPVVALAVADCQHVVAESRQESAWISRYLNAAYRIWETTLAPVVAARSGKTRLWIAPDGLFYSVPFEMLLTRPAHDGGLQAQPFLVQSYAVNYLNRLSDLTQPPARGTSSAYYGFAPRYGEPVNDGVRSGLEDLPYARAEVQSGAEIWNGSAFVDTAANERVFRKRSGSAGILHLAAHARIDDSEPNLSHLVLYPSDTTQDHLLHLYEIYDLELNSQLAILSACQTGSGALQRGEG